jgi:hypothetical protein
MIELVKEIKEGEIVTEKYITPVFIPFSVVYEAIDMTQEIDKSEENKTTASEKELIEKLLDFVANKIYKGQFTKEDCSMVFMLQMESVCFKSNLICSSRTSE